MDPLSFQTLLEEIRPHAQSMLSHFLIFIFSLSMQPLFRWPSNVKLRRLFARTLKSTLPDQESRFGNFFLTVPSALFYKMTLVAGLTKEYYTKYTEERFNIRCTITQWTRT